MRDYIINKLTEWGFKRNNDVFLKEAMYSVPGRRLIINGQQIDEPSQQIRLVFRVELDGSGYIEPPHEDLEWITWQVLQNENIISQYCEGLYNNDQNKFDSICKSLFNQ